MRVKKTAVKQIARRVALVLHGQPANVYCVVHQSAKFTRFAEPDQRTQRPGRLLTAHGVDANDIHPERSGAVYLLFREFVGMN